MIFRNAAKGQKDTLPLCEKRTEINQVLVFITQNEQQRHHLHMIHDFDSKYCTTQLSNVLICDHSELVKVEKKAALLYVFYKQLY